MKLSDLIKNTKVVKTEGDLGIEISGIAHDSRKVNPGDVFVAVPGDTFDGLKFIPAAIDKGAKVIVAERDFVAHEKAVKIIVPSARNALADLSAEFYGHPSKKLTVIGITGTNGKTTTTYLIDSIFKEAGKRTAVFGTVEIRIGDSIIQTELTTPESLELQKYFARCVDEGITHVVMEVSSHSIAKKRIRGIEFDRAVFTNLSHDHLDFHKTMEAYFDTKMKLFRGLGSGSKKDVVGVVNRDDGYSDAVMEEVNGKVITYSLKRKSDVTGIAGESDFSMMKMEIDLKGTKLQVETSLVGAFNAYNILAASALALSLEITPEVIKNGIESLACVPGRFERITEGQDYHVIVDFAHTPDGLEKILTAVKPFKKRRTILVFGCTGDRDKTKRPIMGEIAARCSDFSIITSDDPHNEDPEMIIRDVEAGLKKAGGSIDKTYIKITDRRSAIEKSIEMACQDDIVIIAGRGHEKIQEIKGKKIEIDDREVAKRSIRGRIG